MTHAFPRPRTLKRRGRHGCVSAVFPTPCAGYHGPVARNSIHTGASPGAVFAVLDDAYAYPRWVVGTRRVRAVDPSWPAVGSEFHHAIGTAVAELHDSSKVLERDAPRRLVLEVRFRPTGVARVTLDVHATSEGSTITMYEEPVSGPAARIPKLLLDPVLTLRNAVALCRLRHQVERSRQTAAVA